MLAGIIAGSLASLLAVVEFAPLKYSIEKSVTLETSTSFISSVLQKVDIWSGLQLGRCHGVGLGLQTEVVAPVVK